MRYGQYQDEKDELSNFISNILNDNSLSVTKVNYGNGRRQVHLTITRVKNECQILKHVTLFVNLNIDLIPPTNVYSVNVISSIKESLDNNELRIVVEKLYSE